MAKKNRQGGRKGRRQSAGRPRGAGPERARADGTLAAAVVEPEVDDEQGLDAADAGADAEEDDDIAGAAPEPTPRAAAQTAGSGSAAASRRGAASAEQRRRVGRAGGATQPAGSRRVSRLEPGRAGRTPSRGAPTFDPLDPEDASIPFDRVPYVPADLRRVGVIAGLMVVLIIVADIIVSVAVK